MRILLDTSKGIMKGGLNMKETEIAPVAELYPHQGEWTERDYFALPNTNRHVELSEGRLIVPPLPTPQHQWVVMELAFRLRAFVLERDLGTVFIAPLPVRLWPGKIREPDVFLIAREHTDRIEEKLCGVPDLIVEVISPSTSHMDREKKFSEYARAGIQEYWLVDPEEKRIEVYILQNGVYKLSGKYVPGEIACSELLSGFKVNASEVFRP